MARRTLIPLDSQPQHAQALGRLLGHWGICEHNLCAILGNIVGVEDHKARFIWAAFPSFAAKQKLLRRLNHHYTVNEVAKSSLEALLVQAAKFNSQRNACVHAIWTAGGKDKLGQLNESQSHMVKHSHFKIVEVHEILALVEELSLFSGSLEGWRLRGQGMFGGWSEH